MDLNAPGDPRTQQDPSRYVIIPRNRRGARSRRYVLIQGPGGLAEKLTRALEAAINGPSGTGSRRQADS